MNRAERRNICVFAGSRTGTNPEYVEAARRLGRVLAGRGYGLVYGGGKVGLMGVIADAVLAQGGHVTGVIPAAFIEEEVAHRGLSDLRIVASMHERKALMGALSSGFVALPGGVGTMEELFEVLSWAQLRIHEKPCGLLNVAGYYSRLIDFLDYAVRQDFLRPKHRALLMIESEAEKLLDGFEQAFAVSAPARFDAGVT
jgi:uncharacterized protein (TIGR00730 family)